MTEISYLDAAILAWDKTQKTNREFARYASLVSGVETKVLADRCNISVPAELFQELAK